MAWQASCELQAVALPGGLDRVGLLAFWINLYNMAIYHAFIKLGVASSMLARLSFFGKVAYAVGPVTDQRQPPSPAAGAAAAGAINHSGGARSWNLSEIEHGLLRGNVPAPGQLLRPRPPFGAEDAQALALVRALAPPDPRIHFALNCGASSCPPVKVFSAEAAEEELRIVAMAFCEQQPNVELLTSDDGAIATLRLSKIFSWYESDFVELHRSNQRAAAAAAERGGGGGAQLGGFSEEGGSAAASSTTVAVAWAISGWLRGDKQAALVRALGGGRRLQVEHSAYDWSTNASAAQVFTSASIKTQQHCSCGGGSSCVIV
jgi:hypothetical protein